MGKHALYFVVAVAAGYFLSEQLKKISLVQKVYDKGAQF